MKKQVVKMEIDLSSKDIDQQLALEVERLTREKRALEAKLERREKKIAELQSGMDLTKEVRLQIRELADSLVEKLQDAQWISTYENWD